MLKIGPAGRFEVEEALYQVLPLSKNTIEFSSKEGPFPKSVHFLDSLHAPTCDPRALKSKLSVQSRCV